MAYVKGQPFFPQFTDPATGLLMTSGTVEFYLTGTSTPTPYYTDSIGTSGGTSLTLNSGGKPSTDVFFDTAITYKMLVKNAAGTTLETIDPFIVLDTTFSTTVKQFATLAAAVASTTLQDGDVINIAERTSGNGGGGIWDAVLSSAVTENTFNIVQCTGVATLSLVLRLEDWANSKQFGATGDGVTDDTAAMQASMDQTYANQSNLYTPAGTYLVTGLVVPGVLTDGVVDDRNKGWRWMGQGFGEPFVIANTGGTNIVSVTDAPVLKDQPGTNSSGNSKCSNGTIDIGFIRFDGTSTTPVVLFESQYGQSSLHNAAIHQRSTGDGFKTTYAAAVYIHEVWSMNKDFVSTGLGASRVGVGFNIAPLYDGGLFTLSKCTSRGWNTCYSLGGTANNFSTKVIDCECSAYYNGVDIASTSKGVVIDNLYFEGGEDGTAILDEGDSTVIQNCYIGSGNLTGIDATSITAKGTVITGNTVANGGKANGVCIAVASSATFGGYNKTVNNNYIAYTLGTAGVTGINVSGTDPRLSIFNNSFDPKTNWTGSGTNKIVDSSSSGVTGLMTGIETTFGYEFPYLSKGALSLFKAPTALGQSQVSSGVLTIPDGSYFQVTPSDKSGSITAFADAGGGQVTVTSAAHTLTDGLRVTISGTTNYNGTFTVSNVTTNTFEITDTWVSDDATGSWVTEVQAITQINSGVSGAKFVVFRTTNSKCTFTDGTYMLMAGNFTGPGTITFLIEYSSSNNYAYEIARTVF